jgi:hypothetical protein
MHRSSLDAARRRGSAVGVPPAAAMTKLAGRRR